ncbi:hypothetical protein [Noviherbaspirillum aridicola]|uniref:Uncharacterized protein n=1 Tax=Noviherbaspirillum aridicola TaxID=2849687 RepID=A0ABQ4Q0B3_9BURK|nr:hypothetical protein [Noviherbaspirillum aridicola]GIZ50477.1 hypothetical protein NCCP691_04910 [Noviherbaspirillum aridicola]
MIRFYEYTRTPPYWVAHDDDGYWLVPARDGGWGDRSPFVGHAVNLRPLAGFGGVDLGLPPGTPASPPA